MRKLSLIIFFIFTWVMRSGFAQDNNENVRIFCLGQGLCPIAKSIIQKSLKKSNEPKSLEFKEFSFNALPPTHLKLKKGDIFIVVPSRYWGPWKPFLSDIVNSDVNIFVINHDEVSSLIYPLNNEQLIIGHSVEFIRDPYYPYYLYPRSIVRVISDIFGFLSNYIALHGKAPHNFFQHVNKTYYLEDCLGKTTQKNKTLFVFPNKRFAVFLATLEVPIFISSQFVKDLEKRNPYLNNFKKIIVVNQKISLGKWEKDPRIIRWNSNFTEFRKNLDPGEHLYKLISEALRLTDPKSECFNHLDRFPDNS